MPGLLHDALPVTAVSTTLFEAGEVGRAAFKISGTLDIECGDWDRFAVACIYDGHRPRIFYDQDECIAALRNMKGTVWSHAGGVYDFLWVLECCRRLGISCQVDRAQHRITRIVIGGLTLRCSWAIWPVPLDDIAGAIGVPVPSLPWRCTCAKSKPSERAAQKRSKRTNGCGGYCRITERANEGDPDLEEYVTGDCRVLYDGLHYLHQHASAAGIHLRGTVGQTAWVAAQSELGVPDSDINWHIWRHARRGDRGGRVAIIRPRAKGPGSHHDICNAYPGQLARAHLPVGEARELGCDNALSALLNDAPGMYTCTVIVPDNLFLPPLPVMLGGQINFPTGRFVGTWTLPELGAAVERGVSIEKVTTALVWEGTAPIYGDLVHRWYAERRRAGRKTPFGQWMGGLAKALTGKFAEKPERSRVMMYPEDVKVCLRQGRCRNGCTGRCGAYEQLDVMGYIWSIPFSHLGPSAYPQWSAYLRAQTRVQWLEQAERYGTDLCFGNTDSLWTLGRESPAPLGDGLGQWEFQHLWCDLDVRSATTYSWRDLAGEPELDRERSYKLNRPVWIGEPGEQHFMGVPGMTAADWKRGRGVLDRGLVTFGQAVKNNKGLFSRRRRKWTLPKNERTWYGDRKLGGDGITYPVDYQELRALFASKDKERSARSEKEAIKISERQAEEDDPAPLEADS